MRRSLRIFSAHRKSIQIVDRDCRLFARQNARQRRPQRDRAERRLVVRRFVSRKFVQRAVQPSVLGDLHARRARFHEILRVEVRARRVGRPGGMHNRQVLLFPQRLKCRHRRMQPKETVQIEHRFLRNIDRWPHRVVRRLAVRHNNVQTIGRAALKDHDQPFRRARPDQRRHSAARVRKLGKAAVPTAASALLRRKTRRVIDIFKLPRTGSRVKALASPVEL